MEMEEASKIAESKGLKRPDPDCTDAETTTTPEMQSPTKRMPIPPPPQPLPFMTPPQLRSPPAKELPTGKGKVISLSDDVAQKGTNEGS